MTADLERLEALARAATPGPWVDTRNLGWAFPQTQVEAPNIGRKVVVLRNGELDVSCTIGKAEREYANAAYIAAANPSIILDLISQLRSAAAQAKALVAERNLLIIERNDALVRAVKAEHPPVMLMAKCDFDPEEMKRLMEKPRGQMVLVTNDDNDDTRRLDLIDKNVIDWDGDTAVYVNDKTYFCKSLREGLDMALADVAQPDPNDPLDDVLPLTSAALRAFKPLPVNLPASLDLDDSEGGSHD